MTHALTHTGEDEDDGDTDFDDAENDDDCQSSISQIWFC